MPSRPFFIHIENPQRVNHERLSLHIRKGF